MAHNETNDDNISKADDWNLEKKKKKVLVLYTGGTIGMKRNSSGVYEPEPNIIDELKKLSIFHDKSQSEGKENDLLVTPLMRSGLRVIYRIKEYEPLLDSSNMSMKDWSKIANDIAELYDDYDGFVVLHGTDTMVYTASALSFMCESLNKTIVVTGSQIPIFEVRSDGPRNFLSSLEVAGQSDIPEVLVVFGNKVLRGNRTIKIDSSSFDAFISPNIPSIADLETDIKVNKPLVLKRGAKASIHSEMCKNVGLLRFFPGISPDVVQSFLKPMKGVVLQSYGAGNAPDNCPGILKTIKEAIERGVIIVNVTQCTRGFVKDTYATGKALYDQGVIPGGDMTAEAAFTKLSYVLSKYEWDYKTKTEMMKKNLRGELQPRC